MNPHELIVDRDRILQRVHTAIGDVRITIRESHELIARSRETMHRVRCVRDATATPVPARDTSTRVHRSAWFRRR